MKFTDDDLKRLKERIKKAGGYEPGWSPILARLEAAEMLEPFIIDCLNWKEDEVKPKKWWEDFAIVFQHWRKVAGK